MIFKKISLISNAKAIQHRDTRHAACDEVNKTMQQMHDLNKYGLLDFEMIVECIDSLDSRIMNLPQNQTNQ